MKVPSASNSPLTCAGVSHYTSALCFHAVCARFTVRCRTRSSIGGFHVDNGAEGRWNVFVRVLEGEIAGRDSLAPNPPCRALPSCKDSSSHGSPRVPVGSAEIGKISLLPNLQSLAIIL